MMSRALLILWLPSRFDSQNNRDETTDIDVDKQRIDTSKFLLDLTMNLKRGTLLSEQNGSASHRTWLVCRRSPSTPF
jgi:hypothetical protein